MVVIVGFEPMAFVGGHRDGMGKGILGRCREGVLASEGAS